MPWTSGERANRSSGRGPTNMRKAKAAHVLLCLLASSIWITGAEQLQPGASGAAVQSYLNRTADAVLALKSTRFSFKREGTPAVLDEKNSITFTAADCAYSAPDRVSCNVKVSLKNGIDPAVDARVGSRRHLSVESADAAVRQGAGGRQFQRRPAVCQDRHPGNSADHGAEGAGRRARDARRTGRRFISRAK